MPTDGEYMNPIIAGFYPDPSICRVGENYYLVNSSFQYFPGIPIWHSKDLVHWTQIGNVIDRLSQYPMKGGQVSAGMYAPTIRYHDGTFYVVCTLVGGPGNFYVSAKDPKGPWSDPVFLRHPGGIDPSFFFDDDGKCYVVNCDDPTGHAEYDGHRTIRLQEVDLAQGKTLGEQTVIVNGGTDISKHPVWCEGPHLYKINHVYYLMAAQGGTGTAHTEVIFRSELLRGPYKPWDENPILSAQGLAADRPNPVTCTGHADLVQTQNGEWFAVFLGCQPYDRNFFNTGRETFLLPVTWQDGWPSILAPHTPVPMAVKLPNLPIHSAGDLATTGKIDFTDHFDSPNVNPRWIGLRAPTAKWYVTSTTSRTLSLEPRTELLSGQGNPSYLGVRQQNNDFECAVTLRAQPDTTDCIAGLTAFQNEGHFYAINVKIDSGKLSEVSLEQSIPRTFNRGQQSTSTRITTTRGTPQAKMLATQSLPAGVSSIDLKIEGSGPEMRFFYRTDTGGFAQLGGGLESSFLSTDTAGGFQGVTLGMFAHE